MSIEVTILIPRTDNDDRPFSRETFERWESALVRHHGGYTLESGCTEGGYLMADGTLRAERCYGYTVAVDRITCDIGTASKLELSMRTALAMFRQEAVTIRFLGHMEVIR